jgi:hypothetical protein
MIVVSLDTPDSLLLKSNDTSFRVLYYILQQADLSTNIWYSDRYNKEQIMTQLNLSLPAIDKIIASLQQRLIIIRLSKGKYMLDDYFLDC